jgi:hypothetical protein
MTGQVVKTSIPTFSPGSFVLLFSALFGVGQSPTRDFQDLILGKSFYSLGPYSVHDIAAANNLTEPVRLSIFVAVAARFGAALIYGSTIYDYAGFVSPEQFKTDT